MTDTPQTTLRWTSDALLFAVALFVSAFLLFGVQPMVARQVLPLLGGTPAVWSTCLVFFQLTLLGGYAYAHLLAGRPRRTQVAVHLAVLAAAVAANTFGPVQAPLPPADVRPTPWLLQTLLVTVGLPAFALSASSPLLQRWYSLLPVRGASDPYFLFAGSNLGSLLGLLSYPFVVEPLLALREQRVLWNWGCVALVGLVVLCAVRARTSATPAAEAAAPDVAPRLSAMTRARWVLLAFVPSSLTIGVTTFISTDLVTMPLLWVVPLSIYLLTFVVTFGPVKPLKHATVVEFYPMVLLPVLILYLVDLRGTLWALLVPHLVLLGVIGLLCHGELERERPAPVRLSEFYLWIALGGVLGGMFNALVAPAVFPGIWEYPIVVLLAGFLLPARKGAPPEGRRPTLRDLELAFGVGALTVVAVIFARRWLAASPPVIAAFLLLPTLLVFSFSRRPVRFALGVCALVGGALAAHVSARGSVLHEVRSFFGVHRVVVDQRARMISLFHGTTVHGRRSLDPARRSEPISYYHRGSPIARLFVIEAERLDRGRIGVIGLGSGALVQHGRTGQRWDFFEIDPVVADIARTPEYFPFLSETRPQVGLYFGDGRISLLRRPQTKYKLLVFDAFSSDAIPVHLLTKEALELYFSRLEPDGLLVLHISNRYLMLEPVVAELARATGASCLIGSRGVTREQGLRGLDGSDWAVLSRDPSQLQKLRAEGWREPRAAQPPVRLWTDDYSNVLAVLRWK